MKPRVLHVMETCLERSEVFIYNYLTAHRAWEPLVLAQIRANAAEFPIQSIYTIPAPLTRRSPAWWKAELMQKVTGRSPWHRKVERLMETVAPAVIHAHFGQHGYSMLPLKKRFRRPLITTFYGYDMSVLPRDPRWRSRYSELFRHGDLFLVEGPRMREKLIEMGAPAAKVQIQRIAIHLDRYPAWQPAHAAPTILFVGRFVQKKGLSYALEAVYELRKRIENVQFRIIGDGAEAATARQWVADRNMQSCVTFLGMRPHPEVLRELSQAHVFLQPSVTAANGDTEGGAPTILLEAQAIGIPIVSTFHADIPNVLEQGRGVFLAPERDVPGLVNGLEAALRAPEGMNRGFVEQFHDIAKEIISLEKKYQACCEATGGEAVQ